MTILDNNQDDPHEYEATARDLAELKNADIVVGNGAGYDNWLTDHVEQGTPLVTAKPVGEAHHHDHGSENHGEQSHGEQSHGSDKTGGHEGHDDHGQEGHNHGESEDSHSEGEHNHSHEATTTAKIHTSGSTWTQSMVLPISSRRN